MRVRDWCKESLRWLAVEGVLGRYEESGRFVAPLEERFSLSREQRLLVHYASLQGPLYKDRQQWRKAMALVESCVASPEGRRRVWRPEEVLAVPANVAPAEAHKQLESAFRRLGFDLLDRNEVASLATFGMTEQCTVMDLPEPYGKWHQHQNRRARWEEPVTLELEVRCVIAGAGAVKTMQAKIEMEWSGLQPAAVMKLAGELGRAPGWREVEGFDARRARGKLVARSAETWLGEAAR